MIIVRNFNLQDVLHLFLEILEMMLVIPDEEFSRGSLPLPSPTSQDLEEQLSPPAGQGHLLLDKVTSY